MFRSARADRRLVLCGVGAALLLQLTCDGPAYAAATPEQKCQQSKLKAQGKLKSCLAKSAAGVIGGKADKSVDCQAKHQAALDKADAKATAKMTSCRYIDNGDATVSDLDNGLMWEKKTTTVGSGINLADAHDVDNIYSWTSSAPYLPTGTVYSSFLYKLNGATSSDGNDTVTPCFAGHCDWRLPTIQELQATLLAPYPCAANPCLAPAFGVTQSNYYWTATTTSYGISENVWLVDVTSGSADDAGKLNAIYYARAVRGGL